MQFGTKPSRKGEGKPEEEKNDVSKGKDQWRVAKIGLIAAIIRIKNERICTVVSIKLGCLSRRKAESSCF